MTDDEAFVRAIVDRPGDDTPRLVYADWLDERGDPRGAFVRAEVQWVKEGYANGDADLLMQSRTFDPVWRARVCHPPYGVCCDHLRFEGSGPRLTANETAQIKKWPRVRLSPEYEAFLLNYNGGTPQQVGRRGSIFGERLRVNITRFYPFDPSKDYRDPSTLQGCVERYWNVTLPMLFSQPLDMAGSGEKPWYHDYIPIAATIDDSLLLLIGVSRPFVGDVRIFDRCAKPCTCDQTRHLSISQSFSDFLYRFVPDESVLRPCWDRS